MLIETLKRNIVVIGNGRVGGYFVELLLNQDRNSRFNVMVLNRVPRDEGFRQQDKKNMTFFTGEHVVQIHREEKLIETASGLSIPYDKLVLATGSVLNAPEVEGDEKRNVFVYRTTEDIIALKSYAATGSRAIVCGGGLLGIEAARACAGMGLETTLLERFTHLLPGQQTDKNGALRRALKAIGIQVRCGVALKAFDGNGWVRSVRLIGDSMIPADVVIVAADTHPNDYLAGQAGLAVGEWGGVSVNERLATSDADIYAIGGCADVRGTIYNQPEYGYTMATMLVCNLFGGSASFDESTYDSALKGMWAAPSGRRYSEVEDLPVEPFAMGA